MSRGHTFLPAKFLKNKKDGNEANVGKGQKASSSGEGDIIVSIIIEGEMEGYDVPNSEILNINLKNESITM